jgi:hypothetical protein
VQPQPQHLTSVLNNPNASVVAAGTSPALAIALPALAGVQRSLLDWMGHSSTSTVAAASSSSLSSSTSTLASSLLSSLAFAVPSFLSTATNGTAGTDTGLASAATATATASVSASATGTASASASACPPPPAWLSAARQAEADECVRAYVGDMRESTAQFFAQRYQQQQQQQQQQQLEQQQQQHGDSSMAQQPQQPQKKGGGGSHNSLPGLASMSEAVTADADRQLVSCLATV